MGMLKIFSDSDLDHPRDASLAAKELQDLLRHFAISKANFEKGSLRFKVDIALQKDATIYEKVSFKNMRNFEDIENAIASEVKR